MRQSVAATSRPAATMIRMRRPLLALAPAFLVCVTTAQDRPTTTRLRAPSPSEVVVRCIDANGDPVAGAEVHLFQGEVGPGRDGDATRYRSFGPYETDENGRVRCPVALTYGAVYYFERSGDWRQTLQGQALGFGLRGTRNAEAIAFSPDARSIFVTTEKKYAPLLRIDLLGE